MRLQFDIPAASLATLCGTMQEIIIPDNVPIMGGRLMTLHNIQANVEGSNIVVRADAEAPGLPNFNATVTFQPYVAHGSILVRDLNITTGSALSLPLKLAIKVFKDTIESRINTSIQEGLAGKLAITELEIGSTIRVTCVTSDYEHERNNQGIQDAKQENTAMKLFLALPVTSLSGTTGTFDSIPLNDQTVLNNFQVSAEGDVIIFAANLQWEEMVLPIKGTVSVKPQPGAGSGSVALGLNLISPLPVAGNLIAVLQIAHDMLLVDVLELSFSSPSLSPTRLPATLHKQITDNINAVLNSTLADKVKFTQLKIDADVRIAFILNGNMPLTLVIKG